MAKELQGVDWRLKNDMSIDMMWNRIKEILNSWFEHHIPLQKIKKEWHRSAPWRTKKLSEEVRRTYAWWKEYSQLQTQSSHHLYVVQRNSVTRVIREARKGYEDQILRHGRQGPRRIHHYIRSQLKVKPMIASLKTGAGQMTGSDTETAEPWMFSFSCICNREHWRHAWVAWVSDDVTLTDIEITVRGSGTIAAAHWGKGCRPGWHHKQSVEELCCTTDQPIDHYFSRSHYN